MGKENLLQKTKILHEENIEGKLRTRKWQDKSGNDRYTTEIIADEMQMLGGRGGSGGGGGKGPWGGGGGGGGQQPPDIEELLRRSQDRMKKIMPGGGGDAPTGRSYGMRSQ